MAGSALENNYSTVAPEFNPWFQKYSGALSLLNTIILLLLGQALLLLPNYVVQILLDYSHNNVMVSGKEVIYSVTRMAGGVLLAQGISCLLLTLPLLREFTKPVPHSFAVSMHRVALAVQSITGMLWVIVGLLDDRVNEVSSNQRRETFGLLVVGFCILFLACLALMLSFLPVEEDLTNQEPTQVLDTEEENQRDMEQPLLSPEEQSISTNGSSSREQQGTSQQEDGTSDNEGSSEPTSRIRGTRRLLALAKPQTRYLYIGCIILLIRLPFSLSIPHFVSTTLGALSQLQYDRARREIFWLFILGTIDACLDFWCIFWFGYANQRIVRGVRIDTFASILKQDIGFFDRSTTGELASRLNSDCGEMAGDLTWFFRFSIESVVRITGITAYMLIRSPRLGACALSILPVVAVVNKYYGNWLSKNAQKVQDALAEANSVVQETFSCIRTVIAFASEDFEYNKYVEKIDRQYQLNVRQLYMTGIYYMFISTFLINTVVQGVLLLYGSHLIQQGKLTGEVLLAFMLYQGQLQNEMLNLFQSYSSLVKSSGAGDKVFGLLDRSPPSPGTGSNDVQRYAGEYPNRDSDDAALSIRLESVHFSYPSRPEYSVLSGLDLTIGSGKTVALVGPSGCGKSTIVGLLQRFYDPTSGRLLIDDRDIKNLDIKEHRKRIGVVTQDPTLFSGTILSNITYGICDATREQAIEAARRANAHDFISAFPKGYETEVGERGVQLSGGQKQRIAISRAIIRKPALLLLDEATSALDTESEEIVQAALDSLLNENKGITTVIIAHRLRTVRNADVIAVVDQGRIVESGSHEELMALSGGYYKGMVEKSLGGKLAVT
jgi:ABC-type multidrug transport system fused ATPase/permease subunit